MRKNCLFLLMPLFLFGGCISLKTMSKEKMMKVYVGMKKQEVVDLFGLPDYRRLDNNYEEWEYKYDTIGGGNNFYQIRFVSDVVDGMDSYYMPPVVNAQKRNAPPGN